jgi:hypothetical protein
LRPDAPVAEAVRLDAVRDLGNKIGAGAARGQQLPRRLRSAQMMRHAVIYVKLRQRWEIVQQRGQPHDSEIGAFGGGDLCGQVCHTQHVVEVVCSVTGGVERAGVGDGQPGSHTIRRW